MKTKTLYLTPETEVLEFRTEGVIAASLTGEQSVGSSVESMSDFDSEDFIDW